MAEITITTPDENDEALYNGFAIFMGYQEKIPDEEGGTVLNPQSKQDFLCSWIKNNLIEITSKYLFSTQEAVYLDMISQAKKQIDTQVESLISVTITERI